MARMEDIQYVTDAEGRKTAALVPIALYEAFQESMEDRSLAASATEALADEERIPWEQVSADLVSRGRMDA